MSSLVAYRLWVDLRHRWATGLGLAVLVAVLGGIVLAAAGSQAHLVRLRSPPRCGQSARVARLAAGGPGSDPTPFYDALARLPGVRRDRS